MSNSSRKLPRFVKIVSPLALAIALAACGGGGSSFGTGSGGGGSGGGGTGGQRPAQSQTVKSIAVNAPTELVADSSQSITIEALPINEFQNVINASEAEVKFSVDQPATLEVNGNTATLRPNGATPGTILTVTMTSGEITETFQVEVIKTVTQAESDIKLGSGDGTSFKVGELEILDNDLKAAGKTSIKVSLVDSTNDNELYSENTIVTFNSSCAANELAEFSDVKFNSGVATVQYEAKGCSGVDTITATAVVDGKAIKASSDINIEAAIVGSLSFDTAEPANIGLKGMGLNEVSTVTFTVRDIEGNPVINKDVTFSLSTQTGGITLTSTTAKTNAQGQVSAKVHSGTKATTVKVKAEVVVDGEVIKTESRGLVISTGIADQNSFSLSVETFNPEALGYDGEEVTFYVNAADHFNNPVPDNTAISFTTEAGSIDPFCVTSNGACSVKWRSNGERPADGRVTVLASMQGEESFVDSNGNGLLDDGESYTDLAETYRDDNFDGTFDAAGSNGSDELKDYNENGTWDDKNGEFNGLLCNPANTVNTCSSQKNVYVSDSKEIIMSGSVATIDTPATVTISKNSTKTFTVDFSDRNNQTLPSGTVVDFSIATTSSGDGEPPHSILSEASRIIPNTNVAGPITYAVIIKDGGTGLSSILKIKVTTPKGRTTVEYVNLLEEGTQQEPELADSIELSATSVQMLANGSQPVTISAVVKDTNNNVLSGIPVVFSVDDDVADGTKHGTLAVSTNNAVLTPGGAPAGETLTVTATVIKSTGDIVKTININVVEEVDQSEAADLEFTASSRQLFSTGTDPIVLSATVKDDNNNTISDAEVIFSVDNNATITPVNSTGVVKTANLTPGSKTNRRLVVKATVGSIEKEIIVDVVGTKITVDGPSSIAINKATEYIFRLQDSADKPIAFTDVTITSSLGNALTPVGNTSFRTNNNGELTVSLVAAAGTTAGNPEVLTATASGASITKDIEISGNDFTLNSSNADIDLGTTETITVEWLVNGAPKVGENIAIRSTRGILSASSVTTIADGTATFDISSNAAGTATITAETASGLTTTLNREFVATTPAYLNAQASPSLISPNKSSTIITKVRDANDNPVKNIKVNFNLTDTVNGQLSNSQAVTDSLGRAEVIYTAGDSSSALEGVKILTELQDFSTITDPVALTVGGNALRIVLGSSAKIKSSGDEVFYSRTYGVIVTDSAGNPIANQQVDFTIAATHYNKGYMRPGLNGWSSAITATCPAEDFDHDGNLDLNEDENGNGTLEPTQAATVTGTGTTDDEGKLTVEVVYPKSEAIWSTQRLTATANVSGTEFVEHVSFRLNLTVDDAKPDQLVPNVTITNEDRNGNGTIDNFSEDANANGQLDIGEDINKNGQLDLVVSEDLNGNGILDDQPNEAYYVGAYGSSNDCSNPN